MPDDIGDPVQPKFPPDIKGPPPYPQTSCPQVWNNNICVPVVVGGQTVDCNCEIELRPKPRGSLPNPNHAPLAVEVDPSGGYFQRAPRADGLIVYTFYDDYGNRRPRVEVRNVDGSISVYALVTNGSPTASTYRLVEFVDAHDNTTRYEYDSSSKLTDVHRPDGIHESWNYAPSWIGGGNGWNDDDYSGIEITYYDTVAGQALPQFTYYMVFHKVGGGGPFSQDRIFRVYQPKGLALPPLSGSPGTVLADIPAANAPEQHRVTQFQYYAGTSGQQVGGEQLLYRIEQLTAEGILPNAAATSPVVVRELAWVMAGDRKRVQTETFPLFGKTVQFAYTTDPLESARADLVTATDLATGTTIATSFDDFLRPTQVAIVPTNNATGRPRAADTADNGGLVEPVTMTQVFTYGSCSVCAGKPTRIVELPSGRVTDFTYHGATGLLTSQTVPDPAGGSTGVTTSYVWAPLTAGDTHGTYALQSVTLPDGTQWTHSYATAPRLVPAGSLYRGHKVVQEVATSPSIVPGNYTVTKVTTFDDTAPQFDLVSGGQLGLVGFVTSSTDADGVETTFSHNTLGFMDGSTRNPNGVPAEQIVTTMVPSRTGLPLLVTTHAGTALSHTQALTYTSDGRLASVSGTVGSQVQERRFYYDLWGNLAVTLEKNQGAQGQAPDDFHPVSPRPDSAREWLRNETQFLGALPVASFRDRRALDRDEAGPLVDAADARFQLTTYVHDARGLLTDVGEPNGSTLHLTYDGYGSLYKTELLGSGQPALVTKRFVNDSLELVREVRGAAGTQLVTTLTRNAAGLVTHVQEPLGATPPGYPWTVGRAIHEYSYDAMARVTSERVRQDVIGTALVRDERTAYDGLGRVREVSIFEGSNATPSQVYSSLWTGASMLTKVTGPGGRFTEWVYDALAREVESRDSLTGHPNKVLHVFAPGTDFVQRVEQVTWDEAATPAAYVTRSTEFVRDGLGRVLQVRHGATDPLVHEFTYYSTGNTASYKDPLGKVEQYLPDAMSRLTERFRGAGDVIWNGSVHTDWQADQRTRLLQTDGRGRETTSIYDFAGRLQVVMEPGATAEPTAASPHQSFAKFMAYDAVSRLRDLYTGNDGHLRFAYDGVGRMIRRERVPVAQSTDPHVSAFYGVDMLQRDALGQVIESRSGYGSGGIYLAEQFTRDALGRTHRERFGYETTGLANNWIDVESTYSAVDPGDPLRVAMKYANGLSGGTDDLWIAHGVDAAGRLTNIQWGTSAATKQLAAYLHDGNAIRRRTTTFLVPPPPAPPASFATGYSYDDYGRMTKIEQSFSTAATVEFEYDTASNLVKEKYQKQDGSVGDRFAYDEHNRLLTAWMGSDSLHMASSDPDGGVGSYVKRLTYGMDAANNRTAVDTEAGGSTTTEAYFTQDGAPQGPSNRYEAVGDVKPWHDDRGNLIFDGQRYYVYDVLNRLTEVYLVDTSGQSQSSQMQSSGGSTAPLGTGSGSTSAAATVGPDPGGLTFEVRDISALAHARADILERVDGDMTEILRRQQEPGFRKLIEQELSPGAVAVATGSSPSAGGAFTAGSMATSSATAPDPGQLSLVLFAVYLYDVSDRRVIRWLLYDRPYYYAWDGWEEAQELTLDVLNGAYVVRPVKQFVWGEQLDELVAYRYRQLPGSTWAEYFIAEGGAHCPSRVLDGQGAVVEVQEYDPYGKTTVFHGGMTHDWSQVGNPFQWKGHRHDPETGLLYMRHRYYSSAWGRFMTEDPIGGWADPLGYGSAYQYGMNNPLTLEDRTGYQAVIHGPSAWFFSWRAAHNYQEEQDRQRKEAEDKKAREEREAQERIDAARREAAAAAFVDWCENGGLEEFVWINVFTFGASASAQLSMGGGGRSMRTSATPAAAATVPTRSAAVAIKASDGAKIREALKGLSAGSSEATRMISSEAELRALYTELSAGGVAVKGSSYPGAMVKLPDGTTIGLREVSKSGGPTMDIKHLDGTMQKVHVR